MFTGSIYPSKRIIDFVYDGTRYVFFDKFSGLIAVATRKGHDKDFVLEYGNSHNYYDSDNKSDAELCKREITRLENMYIESEVTFEEIAVECDTKYFVTLNVQER